MHGCENLQLCFPVHVFWCWHFAQILAVFCVGFSLGWGFADIRKVASAFLMGGRGEVTQGSWPAQLRDGQGGGGAVLEGSISVSQEGCWLVWGGSV